MDYEKSNYQRWYRAQSYNWQGGFISSYGAFDEYDPFDTPRELYEEFYLLIRMIESYRTMFSAIGTAYAKRIYKKSSLKKDCEDARNMMIAQYARFSGRWGMLGCGFSRIIDTSFTGCQRSLIHEQGRVKKLILRETDTVRDLNLPETIKVKSLRFNRFEKIIPDKLPISGGPVPLSVWEKDYFSTNLRSYKESVNALAGCRELLSILKDLNNLECNNELLAYPEGNEIVLYPIAMVMREGNLKWRFNSLIQAISIIHILNKSGYLSDSWGICHECRNMFSIENNYKKKYCCDTCRNTATKRNYREKKKLQREKP